MLTDSVDLSFSKLIFMSLALLLTTLELAELFTCMSSPFLQAIVTEKYQTLKAEIWPSNGPQQVDPKQENRGGKRSNLKSQLKKSIATRPAESSPEEYFRVFVL